MQTKGFTQKEKEEFLEGFFIALSALVEGCEALLEDVDSAYIQNCKHHLFVAGQDMERAVKKHKIVDFRMLNGSGK